MVKPCRENRGPYRAVVFDFDGTLARLTLDFERMRQAVADLGARYTSRPAPMDGIPILEWLHETAMNLRENGQNAKARQLLDQGDSLIREMEVEAAGKGELFSFTRPLLRSLREAGVDVAIITRNCSPALKAAFPDALDFTSCLLTRDDVRRVKPDPEHLKSALERLRCPSELALMVGDHPIDITTGHKAGVDSAGVSSGRVSQEQLAAAGACHLAEDCLALCKDLSLKGLLPPVTF